MDEFRLYRWDGFPERYLRFKITQGDLFNRATLLGEDEEARFDRFAFWYLFRPAMLLSDAGRTRLERLIDRQGKAARKLEGEFYAHYRAYREVLIANILPFRPAGVTKGGAVRLAQKLLDRLIFVMFAEDMGTRVGFPPNELVTQLKRFSGDAFLEPEGGEVWSRLKQIFDRMNTGGELGEHRIHRFNGGLFATDTQLDALALPNRLFVRRGQAQNDAKAAEHKQTLYFLAETYNFAREGDAKNSIGLYTLGHIFEQSIVELEALEARAEDRPSLTELTKRKRDGVYYTPEWAVQRIVEEVLDPLFAQWRADAGWIEGEPPAAQAARDYWNRLQQIKVLDPGLRIGRVPDRRLAPSGNGDRPRDRGVPRGARAGHLSRRSGDHAGNPPAQSVGRRHQPSVGGDHQAIAMASHRAAAATAVGTRPHHSVRQQPGRRQFP